MRLRHQTTTGLLSCAILLAVAAAASGQAAEGFTATATVKGAGNATASVPVTITVDRKMSQAEADSMVAAFKAGGASGLRKALAGVKPTGSVTLGGGKPTPTRITIERPTDKGRLLTIVTDQPILHLGAGLPDAKPKEGYDFAVIDLEVDGSGSGQGTFAPAARVTLKGTAFVVEDYSTELVKLTGIKKTK